MTTVSSFTWRRAMAIWIAGIALSVLPVVSFVLQYAMSVGQGTDAQLFRHFTITYIDWVFIPFNLVVVRVIDWRRGAAISLVAVVSVVANIAGHAIWQYHGIDGGHMISQEQVVLPAGWVHLGFSIIEATLILAFIFARKQSAPFNAIATALAVVYFVGAGVSGYVMNHGFIATDAIMVSVGVFLVVFYPRFTGGQSVRAAGRESPIEV
jgi:hypothetical protein